MKAPRATLASLPLAVLAVACGRGAGPAAPPDVPAPSDVAADGDGFGPDGSPHGGAIALDPVAEAWAASIAARPDGGTVAAWVTPRDAAGGTTIVARSFAADDTPGPAFVPAQWTFGDPDQPTVAAGAGGATFAWIRRFALGSDVWARSYSTAPAPAGNESLMNVHEGGTHDAPAATARDGGTVVAWHASGSVPGVFFRFTGGGR